MQDAVSDRQPPQEAAPTVFVVDDDEPMRNALRRLLSLSGLAVRDYPSAREFLDGYRPASSACLLLDLKIMLRTVSMVAQGRGEAVGPGLTSEPFRGS